MLKLSYKKYCINLINIAIRIIKNILKLKKQLNINKYLKLNII